MLRGHSHHLHTLRPSTLGAARTFTMLFRNARGTIAGSARVVVLPTTAAAATAAAGPSMPYTQRRFQSNRPPTYAEVQQALNLFDVKVDCPAADLKKKYIDQVRKNHPDKGGSEEKMKTITIAYKLLRGLSDHDKKQFKTQHNYGPGMAKQQQADAQRQRRTSWDNPYDMHDAYRRRYESQQQQQRTGKTYSYDPDTGHYNTDAYQRRTNMYADSPFYHTQMQMRNMSARAMMFRAMMFYFVTSFCVLVFFRMWKDYTHEEGWAASTAAMRAERMAQLTRLRDEAAASKQDNDRDYFMKRRVDLAKAREDRAMDYAKRREREMVAADHGCFPKLRDDGTEGLIMRDYQDPIGVAIYQPPLLNGAPPFAGNGRFIYSTGSVARELCVPTFRLGADGQPPQNGAPQSGTQLVRSATSNRMVAQQHQQRHIPSGPPATLGGTPVPITTAFRAEQAAQQAVSSMFGEQQQQQQQQQLQHQQQQQQQMSNPNDALPPNMQRRPYTPRNRDVLPPEGYSGSAVVPAPEADRPKPHVLPPGYPPPPGIAPPSVQSHMDPMLRSFR